MVKAEKIMIIRMLDSTDVLAIGVPALRYFQQKLPDVDIHFLTYGEGRELITLAEPRVTVQGLDREQWPDELLPALEMFLGLAEDILSQEYAQIINLDTAFMPCFLARFLKDTGENVVGNLLNQPLQYLLDEYQAQTLRPEYVSDITQYMDSTYFAMSRWHSRWWEGSVTPEFGYSEFYLRQCCSFDGIELDYSLDIPHSGKQKVRSEKKYLIALCLDKSDDAYPYPYRDELESLLEQHGVEAWSMNSDMPVIEKLNRLSNSNLLVTKLASQQAFSRALACPSLFVCGASSPLFSMPDYASEQTSPCPVHSPAMKQYLKADSSACNCDSPEDLVEGILSIFAERAEA